MSCHPTLSSARGSQSLSLGYPFRCLVMQEKRQCRSGDLDCVSHPKPNDYKSASSDKTSRVWFSLPYLCATTN